MPWPGIIYYKKCRKNFGKFAAKYLCQSLFFNKVASWGQQFYWGVSCTGFFLFVLRSFKKRFFLKHLWWLLLDLLIRSCESACKMRFTMKNFVSECDKIYENLRMSLTCRFGVFSVNFKNTSHLFLVLLLLNLKMHLFCGYCFFFQPVFFAANKQTYFLLILFCLYLHIFILGQHTWSCLCYY